MIEAASGMVAIGAATGAIMRRPAEQRAEAKAASAGSAGESRVARALDGARIPAVHDVTIRDQRGTHQIDHVAAAGDGLMVIETKTWRGELIGDPDRPGWTLAKPGDDTIGVYNPIMQNETHANLIRRIAQVPVRSIIVMAGHVRMSGGMPEPIMPLASAVLAMSQAGQPSQRALAGLAAIERLKLDPRQAIVAGHHKQRMAGRKPAPSRTLWSLAAFAGSIFVTVMITHLG